MKKNAQQFVRRFSVVLCAALLPLAVSAASKPDKTAASLSAPVVAIPDISGVWKHQGFTRPPQNIDFMMPWVQVEFNRHINSLKMDTPVQTTFTSCLPIGVPDMWNEAHHTQIVQTPDDVIILSESDHQVRHIYINGTHPANLVATWGGDSIGHWEGDTLVVDTVGYNDKSQIDNFGTPHSEAMHVRERIQPTNNGKSLSIQVTVEDILAFRTLWTFSHIFNRSVTRSGEEDTTITEYACAENNRDGGKPAQ